jgi:dTDP-4-amino-4,6-dideoxy-D-galactose acyltransferase
MKATVIILDWDSQFFEKKIGRIESIITNRNELLGVTSKLTKLNVDLAYYSSVSSLSKGLMYSDSYDIKLVDRKTTYKKRIDQGVPFNSCVNKYAKDFPEQQLLDLSVESGVYSRFKIDDRIGGDKYQDLYRTWIINSVNKKLAAEVLVYKLNETIAGFVTLGEKKGRADIGIIAVSSAFRGKGIAKSLMLSAENWFFQNSGFKEIQVVTQGDNLPACKLYESCGYEIDKVEYFYHLWKKQNVERSNGD